MPLVVLWSDVAPQRAQTAFKGCCEPRKRRVLKRSLGRGFLRRVQLLDRKRPDVDLPTPQLVAYPVERRIVALHRLEDDVIRLLEAVALCLFSEFITIGHNIADALILLCGHERQCTSSGRSRDVPTACRDRPYAG